MCAKAKPPKKHFSLSEQSQAGEKGGVVSHEGDGGIFHAQPCCGPEDAQDAEGEADGGQEGEGEEGEGSAIEE